jgi:CubicO group peptidase (beta-lactamase class C family)
MMATGFEWFEIAEPSEFGDFIYASNQLLYVLNKQFIHPPGTVFDYSDGAAHLISVIISEATGMSASEFANVHLFEPMGIDERFWYEDNQGYTYGGAGLCIGPHDMIKFGNMILNNGEYNGNRIVSSEWLNAATSIHISTNNLLPYLTDYGYYWWKGSILGHEFSMAMGYGGQFIVIVPNLNVVASATCEFRGLSEISGQNWNSIIDVISNNVIPAFINQN